MRWGVRARESRVYASWARRSEIARDCLTALVGVVGIAVVFLATVVVLEWNSTVDDLLSAGHAEFGLWLVMVGGLAALAAGACMLAVAWSRDLVRLCGLNRKMWVGWALTSAVVLTLVVVCLTIAGGLAENHSLASEITDATFPVIVMIGLFVIPGLAYFGLLRSAAQLHATASPSADDAAWLFDLRRRLQTITTVLGVLLTFIVVTTGVRRTALLAINEDQLADDDLHDVEVLEIPIEQVLMYGVLFAFLLGAFYMLSASAIGRRARRLIDLYAPRPEAGDGLQDQLELRREVETYFMGSSALRQFEASVVILSPLVTSLIGAALA